MAKAPASEAGWVLPSSVWSSTMRMQRVAMVLARHGFGEILERRRPSFFSLRSAPPASPDGPSFSLRSAPPASPDGPRAGLGPRLARVLADLGPTFIKLGQLLATREDLFPVEVTRALATLHSGVPPMKPRTVERQLRRALGEDFQRAFIAIDPQPLAAASIGQVHRAKLRSGEEVVVKVQRPGLARMVAADLALMRFFASLLSQAIPELAALEPVALLEAFERSITAELDFTREADNAVRLAELLAGAPEVRVPRIHRALVRKTVLVMEEVHGRRLTDLAEPQQKAARAALLRAFSRQILDHGVFHADPHPGNVLVEATGRLVLIDLGAVERVDEHLRAGLGRLVRALALGRKRALADAVLSLSPNGTTVAIDRARLESELSALVADASGRADGARVLQQMVALGRTHQLKLHPSLLALVRALALLDGVLRGLDPARDLIADLRKEWVLSFGRRVNRWWRRAFGSVTDRARRWRAPPSPAPLLMLPWMHLLPAAPIGRAGSSRPPSI